jgi:hypothetical protein
LLSLVGSIRVLTACPLLSVFRHKHSDPKLGALTEIAPVLEGHLRQEYYYHHVSVAKVGRHAKKDIEVKARQICRNLDS